jgi:hypothetical protein
MFFRDCGWFRKIQVPTKTIEMISMKGYKSTLAGKLGIIDCRIQTECQQAL